MGACLSVAPSPSKRILRYFNYKLKNGDIVMLIDGSRSSKYLFKADSAGGWSRAAKVGFLIREDPGLEGLYLVYADESAGPGMAKVTCSPFIHVLKSGDYKLAIIRRLRKPLSPEKIALVREFVALNTGTIIQDDPDPITVLMASTSATVSAIGAEQFACTDFVAVMLRLVGLVEPTSNPHQYVATHKKGRLAGPPFPLKLRSKGRISFDNSSDVSINLSPRDEGRPTSSEDDK